MKEIIIKTCHGYKRLRIVDGALVPPDVQQYEHLKNRIYFMWPKPKGWFWELFRDAKLAAPMDK